MSAPTTQTEAALSEATHAKTSGGRFLMGVLALLVGSQLLNWLVLDLPKPLQFKVFLASLSLAGVLIALRFLSRETNVTRRIIGASFGLILPVIGFAAVQTDGFLGDGTQNFAWRFDGHRTPSAAPIVSGEVQNETVVMSATWTGFLGNNRDGVVDALQLNPDWGNNPPRELWRRPVGAGWSSFAVANGSAITQEQRPEGEATVCYSLENGEELWVHIEPGVRFTEAYGGDGPRATPTIAGDQVYSLGATGLLNCLDVETGDAVWSRNILEDANAHNKMWAMSGSPLVYENLVVVNAGGANGHSMIAYDKSTGDEVWHSGDSGASYCSPILIPVCGNHQIVMLNGTGLEGYNATAGSKLWDFPFVVNGGAMCSIAQPVVLPSQKTDSTRIFISGGYGKGCALIEVTRDGASYAAKAAYDNNRYLKSKLSNVVALDRTIYGLDEGIMVAVDVDSGKRLWKRGRYGHGQLLLLKNQILIQKESGDLVLVEPNRDKHIELARTHALSGKTWNHPVLVGNLLLVRNDREAICFEVELNSEPLRQTRR